MIGFVLSGCGGAPNGAQPAPPPTSTAPAVSAAPSPTGPAHQQSTPPIELSASIGCLAAMKKAAAETDPDRADPLIDKTLSACESAEDWLIGLREYPGAMGLTERADLGSDPLEVPCYNRPKTPVCTDAKRQGLI